MIESLERLPSNQGTGIGPLIAKPMADDSDSISNTFGVSGMDGFAFTSQPRRVPAIQPVGLHFPGE